MSDDKTTDTQSYLHAYRESIDHPQAFWREKAKRLTWFHQPHDIVQQDMKAVDFSWFSGGKLNVTYNCVDRHAARIPDKTAIIWAKNAPGEYEHITFAQLKREVCRVANVLLSLGVKKGDRVCIYLPMVPDLVYTMLACARLGAIHSVVFAGFSADALRSRILDAGAKVLVTANEGLRGDKRVPLKKIADDATDGLDVVEAVLVSRRTDADVPTRQGRDLWLDEAVERHRGTCPAEWMSSEDPLFVLYTSGSTGRPKGVLHTTAGYLLFSALTHEDVFSIRPDDVYCCAADIGWVTGHSYIVYGPLCNATTTVLFESLPTYPDASRYWQMVDDLGVTVLYTSPTALRALLREGDAPVKKHSRKSLRVLGSVGEPINPEVWQWYYDVVGEGRCPIVDTWWQTETGGVAIVPLPGTTPLKPGAAMNPYYGIDPVLVDSEGHVLEGNDVRGNLCLRSAWPGMARTLYGDHERFKQTYYSQYPGLYFTGDGCHRDADGHYWITGRVDDVLNVSGHRLGTAEIESALITHSAVAEAAVVPVPHELKGQAIYAYVVLSAEAKAELPPGDEALKELIGALKETVRHHIGPIATPERIRIVDGMPKTRSGKIMRRILRKIAEGETDKIGDVSTLADPSVVDALLADAGGTAPCLLSED